MRNMIISLAASALLGVAAYASDSDSSAPVANGATPDAIVTLKGGSVAAGIGYPWGHGELKYRDALHQFAGNYVAAGAGITVAGGGTAVYLKNEHGVIIELVSTDVGLKLLCQPMACISH